MKIRSYAFLAVLALVFAAQTQPLPATVDVSGTVTSDTTWTDLDTIRVIADVIVEDSAHLTIQSGAIIMFRPNAELYIQGHLTAQGEKEDAILFTSTADTLGGSPVAGSWGGVRFQQDGDGSLYYCTLRYANYNVYVNNASAQIHGCVIEDFSVYGIYCYGWIDSSWVGVRHSIIRQRNPTLVGQRTGINLFGEVHATISNCNISRCYDGVRIYASETYAPDFQIASCEISDHNGHGIYMDHG